MEYSLYGPTSCSYFVVLINTPSIAGTASYWGGSLAGRRKRSQRPSFHFGTFALPINGSVIKQPGEWKAAHVHTSQFCYLLAALVREEDRKQHKQKNQLGLWGGSVEVRFYYFFRFHNPCSETPSASLKIMSCWLQSSLFPSCPN